MNNYMQRAFQLLRSFRIVFVGYLFCISFCCYAATQTHPACTYRYSQQSIQLNGRSVTTEYYVPNGPGPFPLVFMLHGSAGAYSLRSTDEPLLDNFGEKKLARSCFAVVLPHYLEAFGYKSMTSIPEMTSQFPQLLAVADTLLSGAESLSWTKGEPVFLFGESLGGYLSVTLGLRRAEVSAVSEISGGIPVGYTVTDPHRVAVLISHGADDTLVPVQTAEDLRQYCLGHQMKVEINLYPGVGHYLPHAVEAKCIATTVEFFLNQLHSG
jgi:poly(3-hydroxybutyrate) depolymerase